MIKMPPSKIIEKEVEDKTLRVLRKLKNRRVGWSIVMAAVLVLGILVPLLGVMAADPEYFTLTDGAFMGRTSLQFRSDINGRTVASNETIHYMAVWVLNQAGDDAGIIMSGNWTDGRISLDGALVCGWTSQYGPWADSDAYEAHNCSECTVAPEYFWVTWGSQGSYTTGWFGSYSHPYLNLGGVGLKVDWEEEEVLGFGQIQLRGRLSAKTVSNVTALWSYSPQVMTQLTCVDDDVLDPPWENGFRGKVRLSYDADADTCLESLVGDYSFICDWLYENLGLDICYEEL